MTTEAALLYSRKFQWLTTGVNPRTVSHTPDDGVRGWKRHAVEASDDEKFGDIRDRRAACGLRAAHGWGFDLFIEKKCARCLRTLGIACPKCRGRGSTGRGVNGTFKVCVDCMCTGQTKESRGDERERDAARELSTRRRRSAL